MDGSYAARAMRKPRRCKIVGQVAVGTQQPWKSWYYVDHSGIAVYANSPGTASVIVKFTARQLRQALELIDSTFDASGDEK